MGVCGCVCASVCVCANVCVCSLSRTKGRGVSCPTDKVSRKHIPTVFAPPETPERLRKQGLNNLLKCSYFLKLSLL